MRMRIWEFERSKSSSVFGQTDYRNMLRIRTEIYECETEIYEWEHTLGQTEIYECETLIYLQ